MKIQVVTAGRHGQKTWSRRVKGALFSGPIFGVKVYEAQARKADGALTWRLVRVLEETFSVETTAEKAAKKYAEEQKLPFAFGVRHGERMTQVFT